MSQTRSRSCARSGPTRSLWGEGRGSGRRVATLSFLASLGLTAVNLLFVGELSLFFDQSFVVLCLVAAFAVRPRDFFVVGMLPPLLMLATVALVAVVAPGAVADPGDGVVQSAVSGLAHHAGALVAGYAVVLAVLGLRQVALRQQPRRGTGPDGWRPR